MARSSARIPYSELPLSRGQARPRPLLQTAAMCGGTSWVFWGLLVCTAVCLGTCCLTNATVFMVLSILSLWMVSLCLHEFGHAVTAYHGGDLSQKDSGALTLNVFTYMDPMLSFAVPVLMLLFGGLPLPGAGVRVSGELQRKWQTLSALAGPVANVLCAIGITALYKVFAFFLRPVPQGDINLALAALAVSVYFQLLAAFLNALPLPPLDGWHALVPYVPDGGGCSWMRELPNRQWLLRSASVVTFFLLYFMIQYIPEIPLGIAWAASALGVDQRFIEYGLFRFSITTNV